MIFVEADVCFAQNAFDAIQFDEFLSHVMSLSEQSSAVSEGLILASENATNRAVCHDDRVLAGT
jgi:hypothetical protein